MATASPTRTKMRIRTGDAVQVIAGKDKGKTGEVLRTLPWENRVVVAVIDSEFTIKRFTTEQETVVLKAENPDYPSIKITPEMDFSVWGVVSWTLKKL